jgi:hypothetical protein
MQLVKGEVELAGDTMAAVSGMLYLLFFVSFFNLMDVSCKFKDVGHGS